MRYARRQYKLARSSSAHLIAIPQLVFNEEVK
jgi:hypothetical protein